MPNSSSSALTGQARGSRPSKPRSTRKRSTSSPFASIFATLASFSSSNATSPVTPAIRGPPSIQRAPHSLPTTSSGARGSYNTASSDHVSAKGMNASRVAVSQALVKRPSTPPRQIRKTSQESSPSPASTERPDVFSFMEVDISSPPTPRPRAIRSASSSDRLPPPSKPALQDRVYSSPIPQRPLMLPHSNDSLSSHSDSDLTKSESSSPPDTPLLSKGTAKPTRKPTINGPSRQDAVGRSINSEDFYRNGKTKGQQMAKDIFYPPEAPLAPHLLNQPEKNTKAPFELPSSSLSPTYTAYPTSPGMYTQQQAYSVPYPTPPLELAHPIPTKARKVSASTVRQIKPPQPAQPVHQNGPSALPQETPASTSNAVAKQEILEVPRRYATLTQTTIMRIEKTINNLEAEVSALDSAAQPGTEWQREQVVMRLSNLLVMHHRLLDTWSKVSQLPRLTSDGHSQQYDAARDRLRQDYSQYIHVNDVDLENAISNVVNDLVFVGDKLMTESPSPAAPSSDPGSLVWAFAALLLVLALQDGFAPKIVIACTLVFALYKAAQSGRLT